MTDKTGGSALPMLGSAAYNSDWSVDPGRTLRDYFAAKAMQGILTNHYMIDNIEESSFEWVAKNAYRMADAMLKARGE